MVPDVRSGLRHCLWIGTKVSENQTSTILADDKNRTACFSSPMVSLSFEPAALEKSDILLAVLTEDGNLTVFAASSRAEVLRVDLSATHRATAHFDVTGSVTVANRERSVRIYDVRKALTAQAAGPTTAATLDRLRHMPIAPMTLDAVNELAGMAKRFAAGYQLTTDDRRQYSLAAGK